MTSRRWYAVEVRVSAAVGEIAAACLWDQGPLGLEESVEDLGRLAAVRDAPWDLAALDRELDRFVGSGAFTVRAFEIEDDDWLRLWKRDWRPTPVGERLLVVPAWWTEPLPPGRAIVRIEPGMAFGTGTHESTILAWEHLEAILAEGGPVTRMLDVGCGTGILSLGVLTLVAVGGRGGGDAGTIRVVATEADWGALGSLRANLALNPAGSALGVLLARSVPLRPGTVSLIVANLTAAEHRSVDPFLPSVLAEGSTVVLSGFLEGQEAEAAKRWRDRGFETVRTTASGRWRALRLAREGAAQPGSPPADNRGDSS